MRPPAAVSATLIFCLWDVKCLAILLRIGSKEDGGNDILNTNEVIGFDVWWSDGWRWG